MTAAEYLASARRLLGEDRSPAARRFLALAEPWERAAGPGHFLESSACAAAGLGRLKLALILAEPAERLARDARRRDEPAKEARARDLLEMLETEGGYDLRGARAALGLLARWRLRGSLMVSLDYERGRGFGKLSFYGYLPAGGLGELAAALALEEPPAGPEVAFFGADFAPDGSRTLKLYRKSPYSRAATPAGLRGLADALGELGRLRDVTRLTRVGEGGVAQDAKVYLGFARGVPMGGLGRLGSLAGHAPFLEELARGWPGQRAYFVGWGEEGPEVYFDRRPEDGP